LGARPWPTIIGGMDEAQKQEIVDGLKIKHAGIDLHSVESETGGVFFVHRRANGPERRIYRQLRADGKTLEAQDSLLSAVLYPDPAELKKLLDEQPFAVEILENAILAASGVYLDAKRKKL
jgi:hypothetical protein